MTDLPPHDGTSRRARAERFALLHEMGHLLIGLLGRGVGRAPSAHETAVWAYDRVDALDAEDRRRRGDAT